MELLRKNSNTCPDIPRVNSFCATASLIHAHPSAHFSIYTHPAESFYLIGHWNDAFSFLAEKAKERRFILAFDEFPYAAAENAALRSILQKVIDHEFKNTGIFLILCGNQVGFMESEVLGYKSPLFGRRTAQLELEGLDYYDASKMLDGFTNEEKLILYSCFGGTPSPVTKQFSVLKPSASREKSIFISIFRSTPARGNKSWEIYYEIGGCLKLSKGSQKLLKFIESQNSVLYLKLLICYNVWKMLANFDRQLKTSGGFIFAKATRKIYIEQSGIYMLLADE